MKDVSSLGGQLAAYEDNRVLVVLVLKINLEC
jgi:hypothetical protein